MMINPCYPNGPIYEISDQEIISSSLEPNTPSHPSSFLYNLSVLKDRVNQLDSVASYLSSDNGPESTAIAIGTLIQEIIMTASSMMFACQQMSLASLPTNDEATAAAGPSNPYWYGNGCNTNPSDVRNDQSQISKTELPQKCGTVSLSPENYHIVELDAADLLAKYTHYCHVCGKGFKRDANLRMHMRAHGEEYKSSAALTNPMKSTRVDVNKDKRKYSCPQQGCRWNKEHAKFQPLKSMICAKNHYKRSHCPKMYVCKRCGLKQFSVLSDLRTHEKHCGDIKWLCSCGTTFSRKDKLMGHVALFVGHAPVLNSSPKVGNGGRSLVQMQLDDIM